MSSVDPATSRVDDSGPPGCVVLWRTSSWSFRRTISFMTGEVKNPAATRTKRAQPAEGAGDGGGEKGDGAGCSLWIVNNQEEHPVVTPSRRCCRKTTIGGGAGSGFMSR